jgi:hypothetical protein
LPDFGGGGKNNPLPPRQRPLHQLPTQSRFAPRTHDSYGSEIGDLGVGVRV